MSLQQYAGVQGVRTWGTQHDLSHPMDLLNALHDPLTETVTFWSRKAIILPNNFQL